LIHDVIGTKTVYTVSLTYCTSQWSSCGRTVLPHENQERLLQSFLRIQHSFLIWRSEGLQLEPSYQGIKSVSGYCE